MSRKRIVLLIIVLTFTILVSSLLYYISLYKAETMIQNIVQSQSHGKIELKIDKVKLNLSDLEFEFRNTEFRTKDSINNATGYHVRVDRIALKVKTLSSIFSEGHLVVDSILIKSPLVEVIKYKQPKDKHISLPEEIKVVYDWLEGTLELVNLNYLNISDAKFRIYNRLAKNATAIELSKINLTIADVSKSKAKTKVFYARNIIFEIGEQNFVFPDGFHGIQFKKFKLETRKQLVKLDSCTIYAIASDGAPNNFNIFVDSVQIQKLDFNLLAKKSILKLDSALCYNPKIVLRLHTSIQKRTTKEKTTFNKDSLINALGKLTGKLNIGYLTVRNAKIDIETEKNNKTSVFKSQNSNFSIGGLTLDGSSKTPIQLKTIKFNVKNYTGYLPDSLYVMKFTDISIIDNKIQLHDFTVRQTKWNKDPVKREFKIKVFELAEIDWMALLYERRIVADHATLINPEVNMNLPENGAKKSTKIRANPFKILEKIKNKVQIKNWFVKNGNLNFSTINGPKISISQCHLGINVDLLLGAENEIKLIDALDTMWFNNGSYTTKEISLTVNRGSYSKKMSSLFFNKITQHSFDESMNFEVANLKLKELSLNSLNSLSMNEISWENATISLIHKNNPKKETAPISIDYKLIVNKLSGTNTAVSFQKDELVATVLMNTISTGNITMLNGNKPVIKDFVLNGTALNLKQGSKLKASINSFKLDDRNTSILRNVRCSFPLNGDSCNVFIPEFAFKFDIEKLLNGQNNFDFIELRKPQIAFKNDQKFEFTPKTVQTQPNKNDIPQFMIARLSIINPEIQNLSSALASKFDLKIWKSTINVFKITSDKKNITANKFEIIASQPAFSTQKIKVTSDSETSNATITGSTLIMSPANENKKITWSFKIDELKLADIKLQNQKNDNEVSTLNIHRLQLENIGINNKQLGIKRIIEENPSIKLSHSNIQFKNENNLAEVYNLSLDYRSKSIFMDSLVFMPILDQFDYMKIRNFQTTYNKINSGKIAIKNIDFNKLLNDSIFYAKKIELNNLTYHGYKDKRLEFKHGVIKPLPSEIFKRMRAKIKIDSLVIRNSNVKYQEFESKTNLLGEVNVNKIRGAITNIKSFGYTVTDSLKLNVAANLMNACNLKVNYTQSYLDTLSTFHLKVIAGSTDLTKLNPILRPFASAEIVSGHLDTLRLSAVGRKYVAYGVMKMYYNDLNINYLDKKNGQSPSFIGKAVSFFANLIVKGKNQLGTNEVFAERNPEIGFLNYWIRIIAGGALTNTGVTTNKAQHRKYFKSIKSHKVPPIPDIPVDY